MPRPKKENTESKQAVNAFQNEVEQALKKFANPLWLGQHSVLASPYFLGALLHSDELSSDEENRGKTLQTLLHTAKRQMIEENKKEGEEWGQLLQLVYLSGADLSIAQITDKLALASATYNRKRNEAIGALAKALLKLVRPSLRLEIPITPHSLIGREEVLDSCLTWLHQRKSVGLVGASGVGKTSVGAVLAQRFAPKTTFWYSFQPGLNDHLYSLLFALGYFLHQHGASGLWSQIVAERGSVKLATALNLLRDDLAKLDECTFLFCFDEVDLLRPSEVEAHTQIIPFLETLRGVAPLLLIGQKHLSGSDFPYALSGLTPSGTIDWCKGAEIVLSPSELTQLYRYTEGNPRLLELFLAYYQTSSRTQQSFQAMLTSLSEKPSVEFLLRRVWQHLNEHERVLLELLAVFRQSAPHSIESTGERRVALQQLQRWRLVQIDTQGAIRLLPAFKHAIDGLLEADEKEVAHLEAALICSRYGQQTEAAYHLVQAGEAQTAVQLLYLHREQAINQGQAESALQLLHTISQRHLSAQTAETLSLLRVELYQLLGHYDPALKLIQETYWSTPFLKARAKRTEGDIRELRGEVERALKAYQEGVETVERWFGEAANYHRALGYLHLNEIAFERAQIEVQRIRHEAANLDGAIHEMRGEISAAQVAYQEALQLARAANYPYGEANTQNNLGQICGWRRQLAEAEQHLYSAIEFFTNTGRLNKQASAIYNLALVRRLAEEYEAALEPAEESLRLFERLGETYGTAVALELLSEIYLGLKQFEKAQTFVQRVLQEERTGTQPDGLRTLGEICLAQGNLVDAAKWIRESLVLSEKNDNKILQAYAWRALSKVHLAQNQQIQATDCIQSAINLFNLCGLPEEAELTKSL